MSIVILIQFGTCAQRFGKKKKSEIRNPWRYFRQEIKNENHVNVLVEYAKFLYQT